MVQKENNTKDLKDMTMSKILNKKMIIKLTALIAIIALMVGVTIAIMPWINSLQTPEGREKLELYIESKKTVGTLIYIGLQAFQVILPVIPPIQIVGGALFGTFWGSVLSFIGLYVGMGIVYGLVRLVGYPLVEAFVNPKNLKRFKFLQEPDRVALIFFVIYLIPAMPKDALSFLAPLTSMDKKTYFLYVLPARLPLVILSVAFGSSISNGNYSLAVILSIIMVDIGIIGIIFREKVISYFEKKTKSKRHTSHKNDTKHNRSLKKTGTILIFSSLILVICDLIFMATDYFSRCKAEFLELHDLKGHNQIFYFISNYGLYWFISVFVIGLTAYLVSYKKRKIQNISYKNSEQKS